MSSEQMVPTKYLLAVDGSIHAQAAAQMLSDLITCRPDSSQICIQLLAVFAPVQATELQPLQQAVHHIEEIFQKRSQFIKSDIVLGHAAEKIIEYGETIKPEMIVMGAKGMRATLGILLGGVAQQVVEYGHWPVLIVRAPYHGLRKILVVTDGSRCSEKAATFMGKLSLPAGVRTYVMHVLPPIPPQPSVEYFARAWPLGTEILPPVPLENDAAQEDWMKEEDKRGQIIISQTIESLSAFGLHAEGVLLRGDAATEIIEHTNNYGIDLIITGSRGLSSVKSWLLGSVSRKLVHYAGCSVLVVREIACTP